MCVLASRAYFCPGPGSSEVILQMAACASVKMVADPIVWLLVAATCRALARAAHGVEGFLAPTHVGLVAFPGHALLPCNRIASRSVLQAGSVREDGQAGPVKLVRFQRSCGLFLDRGGCVQGGGHLEKDRVFSAIPASEGGLQSFPEGAVRGYVLYAPPLSTPRKDPKILRYVSIHVSEFEKEEILCRSWPEPH